MFYLALPCFTMPNTLFAHTLISWFAVNARNLPWRNTRNPYLIWLSEVILQQTRVAQGLPYYLAFTEAFPTVQHLAAAHPDHVLRLWQGLGYYSRARSLHASAKHIANELNGAFPGSYAELLKLKGTGPYTAAAVSSFAYAERQAVLDGNVFRVLARYFGLPDDIASGTGKKKFATLAKSLLPQENSEVYNQAVMEFGALQCTPAAPDCNGCPLNHSCVAYNTGQVGQLPNKPGKNKVRTRFLNYLVLLKQGKIWLEPRRENEIWEGLWQPLLYETDEHVTTLFSQDIAAEIPILSGIKYVSGDPLDEVRHKLSHQLLVINILPVYLPAGFTFGPVDAAGRNTGLPHPEGNWFKEAEAEMLPKPVVIARSLQLIPFKPA